jgi:hypothetical protein
MTMMKMMMMIVVCKGWFPVTDFYDDDDNNNNINLSLCTNLARAFKTSVVDKVTWNVFGRNWSWRNRVTLPSLV